MNKNLLLQKEIKIKLGGSYRVGAVLLFALVISTCVLEKNVAHIGLESSVSMIAAGTVLLMEAVSFVCIPVLLLDGFKVYMNSGEKKRFTVHSFLFAAATEITYDLAIAGKTFSLNSQNAAFAYAVGVFVLFVYEKHEKNNVKSMLVKTIVTVAAVLWMNILSVDKGIVCLVYFLSLYWFRKKKMLLPYISAALFGAYSIVDPLFMLVPFGAAFMFFVNFGDDKREEKVRMRYVHYPLMLCFAFVLNLIF